MLLILALVATTFWVFTIVDCAVQPPIRHRGVSKPVWILIVVLLPVLGGVLWLAVGRMRRSVYGAKVSAPDDDPEFLGRIGTMSDQDERIRRLEEELAQLDSEGEDPRRGGPSASGASSASSAGTAVTPEPPARGVDGDDDIRGQRGATG